MSYELGLYCHWCGNHVSYSSHVKSGKHLYCRNGGKCKMAHARAMKKYQSRVTGRAAAAPGLAQGLDASGNAKPSAQGKTSSPAISARRIRKGNARKGRK